jgi:hypothetical protein
MLTPCVPVLRGWGTPEVIPYIVLTNEVDLVSGAVEMSRLGLLAQPLSSSSPEC